jgi:hypothetical protein
MSCDPFNYTNYSTGNASCTSHRDACATNGGATLSSDFGISGGRITAADIENLRSNIISEIVTWNNWNANNRSANYTVSDPGTISSGQVINHTHINNLNDSLAAIINFTANNTKSLADGTGWTDATLGYSITNNGAESDPGVSTNTGNTVNTSTWNSILSSYNTLRQDCICNSDCHCNNVCSCYGNCGCNYASDERLKEKVQLIDTEGDLNVYSYTYLWDKTKTYIGVMAQELVGTKYESALGKDSKGFYSVDYSQLPVKFREV